MDRKGVRSALIGGGRRRWDGVLREKRGGGVIRPPWGRCGERRKLLRCNPQHLLLGSLSLLWALFVRSTQNETIFRIEKRGKNVSDYPPCLTAASFFLIFWASHNIFLRPKPKHFSFAFCVKYMIVFSTTIFSFKKFKKGNKGRKLETSKRRYKNNIDQHCIRNKRWVKIKLCFDKILVHLLYMSLKWFLFRSRHTNEIKNIPVFKYAHPYDLGVRNAVSLIFCCLSSIIIQKFLNTRFVRITQSKCIKNTHLL